MAKKKKTKKVLRTTFVNNLELKALIWVLTQKVERLEEFAVMSGQQSESSQQRAADLCYQIETGEPYDNTSLSVE